MCVCVGISLLRQPKVFKCGRGATALSALVIDTQNSRNSFEWPENSSIQLHHGLIKVGVSLLRGFRGRVGGVSRHLIPHDLRTLIDGARRVRGELRVIKMCISASGHRQRIRLPTRLTGVIDWIAAEPRLHQ